MNKRLKTGSLLDAWGTGGLQNPLEVATQSSITKSGDSTMASWAHLPKPTLWGLHGTQKVVAASKVSNKTTFLQQAVGRYGTARDTGSSTDAAELYPQYDIVIGSDADLEQTWNDRKGRKRPSNRLYVYTIAELNKHLANMEERQARELSLFFMGVSEYLNPCQHLNGDDRMYLTYSALGVCRTRNIWMWEHERPLTSRDRLWLVIENRNTAHGSGYVLVPRVTTSSQPPPKANEIGMGYMYVGRVISNGAKAVQYHLNQSSHSHRGNASYYSQSSYRVEQVYNLKGDPPSQVGKKRPREMQTRIPLVELLIGEV